MLARTPEEAQLRFLHAVSLSRTGESRLGDEERAEARRLGLAYDREVALCEHLGLPVPPKPAVSESAMRASPAPVEPPVRASPRSSKRSATAAKKPRAPPKRSAPTRKRK